jgi:hypothetical protein
MPSSLQLGPIVGHTDETTAKIWIQVFDDPEDYQLRVKGAGLFGFTSTEASIGLPLEFHTGIAFASELRADWRYHYDILRKGRSIHGANGTFRTMPISGSNANILFCAISCNSIESDGAWEAFGKFVKDAKPHFIMMMGDQVYIDEDKPDIFEDFVDSQPQVRRKALAEKYRTNWSRRPIKEVMANTPIYMMWDDHEIRDGWGSLASDSETLLLKYPKGKDVFDKCTEFFKDAQDVYWHFQACHNPLDIAPSHTERRAMHYAFRCGRLQVLMLDSRGERDVFRKELPILGNNQWQFINQLFNDLPDDVDAIAIMTPTPIASVDPNGQGQKLVGNRTDDIRSFSKGDFKESKGFFGKVEAIADAIVPDLGTLIGMFKDFKSNIDEARDQWSHKFSRAEQQALIRAVGNARLTNRNPESPREVIFLSGDIHTGCIFDITVSEPEFKAASLTSSGISTVEERILSVGVLVDEDFDVAPGIHSSLREIAIEYNYGVIQVIPTGNGAKIVPTLAHKGNSFTVGLDFADLL